MTDPLLPQGDGDTELTPEERESLIPSYITFRERARALAKRRLRSVSHSMALEDQAVDEEDEKAHLERLVQELMSKRGSALWEDE